MTKAAKKTGSHVVQGIDEDPRQTTVPGADAPAQKTPLTSDELRALFDAWKAAGKELDAVKATVEAAAVKRSDAAKAIVDALGNKGPWNVDGDRLSVSVRGDRYNMQRESDAKLTL